MNKILALWRRGRARANEASFDDVAEAWEVASVEFSRHRRQFVVEMSNITEFGVSEHELAARVARQEIPRGRDAA